MTRYQKLLAESNGGVARITLNRPEKRNALDPELISELRDAIAASARGESTRVVLLKGAGKDFCSGMDLAALEKKHASGCAREPIKTRKPSRICFSRCGVTPGRSSPRYKAVHWRAAAV